MNPQTIDFIFGTEFIAVPIVITAALIWAVYAIWDTFFAY